MTRRIRVGQTHEDHDLAARVASTGSPPFAAVDDPLVTFAARIGLHVGGIRGSNARLGHTEAGADLTGQQGLEPLFLVLFGTVANDGFHVAGIGSAAVKGFRRQAGTAHQFGQRCVFQVGEACPKVGLRQEQVPQSGCARLDFQLLNDGSGLPAVAFRYLLVKDGFSREHMLLHEAVYALAQLFNLGGVSEIHSGCLWLVWYRRSKC